MCSGARIIGCVYGVGEGRIADVSECLWNTLGSTGEGLRHLFSQEVFLCKLFWLLCPSRLSFLPWHSLYCRRKAQNFLGHALSPRKQGIGQLTGYPHY